MSALALSLTVLVGVTLGLLGGGGSILTLPILMYAAGLPPKEGIATSLLVVAGASFVAMLGHARRGRVSLRVAAPFGAASMATSYVAARLAHHVPDPWLLGGFTVLLLLTGAAMLRPPKPRGPAAESNTSVWMAGAGVGCATGLVGAGGGFLMVPALVLFARLEMSRAIGTSLLIITLNSLAGYAGYAEHVDLEVQTALIATGTAALGALLGSMAASRVQPIHLRRAFAVLVLVIGSGMTISLARAGLEPVLHDARVTHVLAAAAGALITVLILHLRGRATRAHVHSHSL